MPHCPVVAQRSIVLATVLDTQVVGGASKSGPSTYHCIKATAMSSTSFSDTKVLARGVTGMFSLLTVNQHFQFQSLQ